MPLALRKPFPKGVERRRLGVSVPKGEGFVGLNVYNVLATSRTVCLSMVRDASLLTMRALNLEKGGPEGPPFT